jgi:hypothetical protein
MPNYHPAPQVPLRNVDAYTSWPGGVDPTVKLYNADNQKGGKNRKGEKNRKATRKNRKNRKTSRKNRKDRR